MPCLEVTLPRVERAGKERLAAALTRAFSATTGFPPELFAIHFRETGPDEVSIGGRLAEAPSAPYLHVVLYCPRLKRAQKQELVRAFTDAFATALDRPAWRPVIHISEHPYDNVGVEGKLLSDAYEECAARPFYYPLPRD